MASRCCPPRSATAISVEQTAELLRGGSIHEAEKTRPAVEFLERLGLIRVESFDQVLCANPRDKDYAYVQDRSCGGRITLNDVLDEDGNDFVCPECSRVVYPHRNRKARLRMIQVTLNPDGIAAHVERMLANAKFMHKKLEPGLWRVDVGAGEARLVVVGYCRPEVMGREWAASNRACYLVVDAVNCHRRFRTEEWLVWGKLAEVICRPGLLVELLDKASRMVATNHKVASVPVYSVGTHPVAAGSTDRADDAGSRVLVDLRPMEDGFHWIVNGRDNGRIPRGTLTAWSQVLFENIGKEYFVPHNVFQAKVKASSEEEYRRSHKQNRSKLKALINFEYDEQEGMRLPQNCVKSK